MLLLFFPLSTMPPTSFSSSSSSPSSKPRKPSQNPNPNPHTSFLCKQHPSPSATLDLLILLLVLFSSLFLISSIISYLSLSFSLLLPSLSHSSLSYIVFFFLLFFAASFAAVEICCGIRGRRCHNPKCQGLKKANKFDLQLQTEECLRVEESKREFDDLPWKGGVEGNPDYECLVSELRRMAPANGRAVLLFRAKCGCAVAKLEAWGSKRGRRHKKSGGILAIDNGDR